MGFMDRRPHGRAQGSVKMPHWSHGLPAVGKDRGYLRIRHSHFPWLLSFHFLFFAFLWLYFGCVLLFNYSWKLSVETADPRSLFTLLILRQPSCRSSSYHRSGYKTGVLVPERWARMKPWNTCWVTHGAERPLVRLTFQVRQYLWVYLVLISRKTHTHTRFFY